MLGLTVILLVLLTLKTLFVPNVNTSTYGLNSLIRNSIISWNSYIKLFKNDDVAEMSKNELKNKIKKHMLSTY